MLTLVSCVVCALAAPLVPPPATQEPEPTPPAVVTLKDAPKRPVFVRPFGVALQPSGRTGRVGRLREDRRADRAVAAATSLAEAIVRDFVAAGYPAQFLAPDEPLPGEGWLLRGAWYALDTQGGLVPMPHFLGGEETANVDLSVSVADLAVDPEAPFVVFGSAEALRGQTSAVAWNPYVIAAKFVAHKAKGGAELDSIAKEIVDTILANRATLAEKARAPVTP